MRASARRSLLLLVLAMGVLGAIVFYLSSEWIAGAALAQCGASLRDRALSLALAGARSLNVAEHQGVSDPTSPEMARACRSLQLLASSQAGLSNSTLWSYRKDGPEKWTLVV